MARMMKVMFFAAALSLMVCGCASKPKPTVLEANFTAALDVNPDRNGRPSPIVIWIYELSSVAEFATADFFSLTERDGAYLADDLVGRTEYQLDPGESVRIVTELSDDAKHVGVVAAYRDIERARWRGLEDLIVGKRNPVEIFLDHLAVSIKPAGDRSARR